MEVSIFKVFVLSAGEWSMTRYRDSVQRIERIGRLLLTPFAHHGRVSCTYCTETGGTWLAFYVKGVTQLDLFRNWLNQAEQLAEIEEADQLVRRQLRALRDLVGQLTLRPTQFWDVLEEHAITIEDFSVLSVSPRYRPTDLTCVHPRGAGGQTVIPLEDLPPLFACEQPLQVRFKVHNVNTRRAEGCAMHFVDRPVTHVRDRLTLMWKPEERWKVVRHLLRAFDAGVPVCLTAYPVLDARGELARLDLVELERRSVFGVVRRIRESDWFSRDWPMPKSESGPEDRTGFPPAGDVPL